MQSAQEPLSPTAARVDTFCVMKRPLLALLTLAAALGLVAAGCGGVAEQADGTVPDSASLAPADAIAFATVTTDESSEQWQQAADLLDRLPGAKDDLTDEVTRELRDEGLTW
jgi:ABC-type glycerol-3-phosphate transport system substrate-binding protein